MAEQNVPVTEEMMVLTKDGVKILVADILRAVNNRIQGRIGEDVSET